MPEPPSVAWSVTETSCVYQPVEHGSPSQLAVVTGAVVSAVTVKVPAAEIVPAPFTTVTLCVPAGAVAVASNEYASPPAFVASFQPAPSAGNRYESIPDCASEADAVTVKPPVRPSRT